MHYTAALLREIKLKLNCIWLPGLSKTLEVDGWVVKVLAASLGIFNSLKNAIRKELPSRVAGRY